MAFPFTTDQNPKKEDKHMISEREENDAIAEAKRKRTFGQNAVGLDFAIAEAKRKRTFGQNAVGLGFNPSGDPVVNRLKTLYAEIIDIMDADRRARGWRGERTRLASVAITEAQGAQMWAVKAVTWED